MTVIVTAQNEFLQKRFFEPISLCKQIPIIDNVLNVKNSTVLIDAIYLTPDTIDIIKNNSNKIIAFDINDNSAFCCSYYGSEKILEIDHIFKIAGLQRTVSSKEISISNNLEYSTIDVCFMDEINTAIYNRLLNENRLHSLPYVLWFNPPSISVSEYDQRIKLALVRGGHHYQRVHLYLNLLAKGLVDNSSQFNTHAYLFQYCGECKEIFNKYGKFPYDIMENLKSSCSLPDKKQENYFNNCPNWNNSCTTRYFQLAKQFNQMNSKIDIGLLEHALNGYGLPENNFFSTLSSYLFYADYKWLFSIYAPPRFWEAAAMKTISLVPRRMNDQSNFPVLVENDHYITFAEDFSDLSVVCNNISKEKYQHITENCFNLYNRWIKSRDYLLNTNMINYIIDIAES